jgi:Fe-S cluster biogenesis protein NfuA
VWPDAASREIGVSGTDHVQKLLERIRPFLQADGGDLEVVKVEGQDVSVRLTGACADCPQASITLHFGLETALRATMPDVRVVRVS